MKKTEILAALCVFTVACGGNSGPPPAPTFTYGSPVAPTYTESSAATSASTALSNALTLNTTSDKTTADSNAGTLTALGDAMASSMLGSMLSVAMPANAEIAQATSALSAPASSALISNPDCYALTATASTGTLTYNNCSETSSGLTGTVNGSISWSSNVDASTISWDLTVTLLGTVGGTTPVTMNVSDHLTGKFTLTSTTFIGSSRSDVSGTVSGNGQTVSFAYSTSLDANLNYKTGPFCITDGTLELKRWWPVKPAGSDGNPFFDNQGIKFIWSGGSASTCATTLTIAHST